MATGDPGDITSRLRRLLPNGWFASVAPVLNAVLQAPATAMAYIYSLWAYAKQQCRIRTATDGFLDLISLDYFGTNLPRYAGELDAAFRARILENLLAPKVTRAAMVEALENLTGNTPQIFEPFNVNDATCYGSPRQGYGVAGGYGSLALKAQCFIKVKMPAGAGVAGVNGYGGYLGGYGVGAIEWINPSMTQGKVTEADVYNKISETKADGVICWTSISG